MNFFELFEIPVQLRIDRNSLSAKYFALSRLSHPDYFATGTGGEQEDALERSAMLNKAYRTLQHPDETIKYVLQLKGLQEEEEKYKLPPGFLMEVMEINEELDDVKMGDDPEKTAQVLAKINDLQSEIYEPVKKIIDHYQEGITTEKELLQVKEYYYKKKYLLRILRQLNGKS